MKYIVKKIAPILMTLAMIGLGGQLAQANVLLNGLTWGDPFTGLVNQTKAQQLITVSGFGGHVATWTELRTSADTNANNDVSATELETFLVAIGFPSLSSNGLCPANQCYARLSGFDEEVYLNFVSTSRTYAGTSFVHADVEFPGAGADGIALNIEGMLWIVNTPEPGIIGLLGFSLFGLAMLRKRNKL